MAEILSPILNISKEELLKKFSQEGRFVWIKRLMEPEEALKVEELLKSKDWERFLGFREESKRYYPNGRLLANVIGFVGVDDKALDGLELYLGDILKRSKEANSVRMRIDAKGNPIMESALTPYKSKGENSVYLTIDQTIQFYAERALDRAMTKTKAQGGIIIVMDPKTGEILALGNRPTYDPNHFEKAVEKDFKIKQLLIFMNRVRPLNRLLLQPHLMQEHTPRRQSGMIPVKFGHRDMQSEIGMMGHMVM